MWNTASGLRILEGIEAKFYLEAMQLAVDYLEQYAEADEEVDVFTCDRIFDSASFEQKIALLHRCLAALLDPTVEAPILTNTVEAAAYFPLAYIHMRVEEEIEIDEIDGDSEPDDSRYCYRQMVWEPFSAYLLPNWQNDEDAEETQEDEAIVYDISSNDVILWEEIIDGLANRIFWDRDWQMTTIRPQILDGIDPNVGTPVGLTDDYITNRLPKVSPKQVEELLAAIKNWG
ncbi:MAG: hypothetical protein HC840_07550 [Leptolyngbyaceae cyanobacterium RM2_2_4]|nr:hypothetical protein [Leptolyngbyaceae cyanobacterium SM1_4_3]NJO49319.1 hypothetical protein [Leptolyngbyaceae cyanobacterium RM2_2_4]NJO66602.1 hypothetical protein [Leptolyngbyaceae cyanobacterium RM1_405_57]